MLYKESKEESNYSIAQHHDLQGYLEKLWVDNQLIVNAPNDGSWCSIIGSYNHGVGLHMRSID